MTFFISDALAQVSPTVDTAATNNTFSLIMIAAIFVLFYFMLIRPQNKRAKEHRELVAQLKKGDEIITSSGILGTVIELEEPFMKVKIADNVEISMLRNAINKVLPKGTIKTS